MRTLTHAQILNSRRLARYPLPGCSGPSSATLDAMEDVRSLVASHGRTDDSIAATASVAMLVATHGRSY